MGWESQLLLWIQETIRTPFLDQVISRITTLGDHGLIWIAFTLVLLIIPKTRKAGLMCALGLILMVIFNDNILKPLINRPRPYTQIPGLKLIVKEATDASFPSGHACSAFAVATVCLKKLSKYAGIPVVIFAAFMSLTRLYVGIHYPTDVIAGALIGILIGIASVGIINFFDKKGWFARRPSRKDRDKDKTRSS